MRMRLCGMALSVLAFIFSAPSADAGSDIPNPIGVVELFTSQGCNSCPPADEVLAGLAQRGDVVALGYHVDYWDYLGWRDTLARPENTQRQHDYREAFGGRSVYTPQAVVNGRMHLNGAKGPRVKAAIETMARTGRGMNVPLKVQRRGESLIISAGDARDGTDEAHLMLVYFGPPQGVDIGGGENGGRKVVYWNPVTAVQAAGMWHGKAADFEIPASEVDRKGAGGCAVLLQARTGKDGPGPILGATLIGARPPSN